MTTQCAGLLREVQYQVESFKVYNAYPRDPLHVISDTPRSILSYR
jgi:hypothetical protein